MSTGSLNDIITQLQADIASLEDIGGEARNRKLKLERSWKSSLYRKLAARLMGEIGALPSPIKEETVQGMSGLLGNTLFPLVVWKIPDILFL